MERIAVLYTSAGEGHRGAARAIAEQLARRRGAGLRPDAIIELRDALAFAPRWFAYGKAWQMVQQRGGAAWDWLFDATQAGLNLDRARLPLHRAVFGALDRFLIDFAPTHVVCTHYLPAVAVARVRARLDARVVMTITDHQSHPAWIVPGVDAYCVADDDVARAVRRRCGATDIAVTGIPIAACAAPLRAVAPQPARPRVLVLLGGLPRRDAFAAIDALAPLARAGQALHVLCGGDDALLRHAQHRLPGAEIAARVDGLYPAIDRADLVVTKTGGLTVSECLARGRAMVMPFAARGQERGNLRYAIDAGAAVRPSEIAELGDTIAALIAEPGRLRRMAARARMAARPDAASDVVARLLGGAVTSAASDREAVRPASDQVVVRVA